MNNFMIEKIKQEEAGDVYKIWYTHYKIIGVPYRDEIAEYIKDEMFFCIRNDIGEIIAMCAYDIMKRKPEVRISALFTRSDYRNQGLAIRLITHIANLPNIKPLLQSDKIPFIAIAKDGIENNTFYDKISHGYELMIKKSMNLRRYILDKSIFVGH